MIGFQKIIKEFEAEDAKKRKNVKTHLKDATDKNLDGIFKTNGLFKNYEKLPAGKIKGKRTDGVLIEIFIKTKDSISIGDKITFGVAVKSVISQVIDEDNVPFSEYDHDEEIEGIISPFSPINRLTCDFFNQLCINKVLLELKKKVKKIVDQ